MYPAESLVPASIYLRAYSPVVVVGSRLTYGGRGGYASLATAGERSGGVYPAGVVFVACFLFGMVRCCGFVPRRTTVSST